MLFCRTSQGVPRNTRRNRGLACAGIAVLGCIILAALVLVAVKQSQGVEERDPEKSWSGKTEDKVADDFTTITTTISSEASSKKDRSLVHKLPKIVTGDGEEGNFTLLGNLDLEAIMELWGRQDCGGARVGEDPHCSLMQQLNSSAGLLQVS